MFSKLDMMIDHLLLEQTVNQKCLKHVYMNILLKCCTSSADTLTEETDVELTVDKMNIIRYVGGYVACSLLKKCEKQKGYVRKYID